MNMSVEDKKFWYGRGICLDSEPDGEDWDFSNISIDGQSINMDKCKITQRFIETNETICITKRLKAYESIQMS